jgi:hypothetical protein
MARTKNEKIEALNAKVAELNKQVREESQRLLNDGFVEVFAKYPKLISFKWHQYTPYFNDGDMCTFRVNPNSLIPDFTDESAEDYDYEYEKKDSELVIVNGKWMSKPRKVSEEKALNNEAFDELYEIIDGIDDATMLAVYGDHAEITISKKKDGTLKVEIEETEHD